jgi:hypothetical protein
MDYVAIDQWLFLKFRASFQGTQALQELNNGMVGAQLLLGPPKRGTSSTRSCGVCIGATFNEIPNNIEVPSTSAFVQRSPAILVFLIYNVLILGNFRRQTIEVAFLGGNMSTRRAGCKGVGIRFVSVRMVSSPVLFFRGPRNNVWRETTISTFVSTVSFLEALSVLRVHIPTTFLLDSRSMTERVTRRLKMLYP